MKTINKLKAKLLDALGIKPYIKCYTIFDINVYPSKNKTSDGGYDIKANLMSIFDKYLYNAYMDNNMLHIKPGGRALIPTGLHFSFSSKWKMNMRPRSGLALKQGITLVNSPGLIDADYRDDVGIILINHSNQDVIIQHGDRIAQIEFVRNHQVTFDYVNKFSDLDHSNRNGGFGSSGTK